MSELLTTQSDLPPLWREASITLIPKEGSLMLPSNYHPISLLQVSYKLYTSIITSRLTVLANKYILSPHQMGFRPGMSSTDALRVVVDIVEDVLTFKKELHVAYVDCKKAFDYLHHHAIFEVLTYYGLGEPFINAIKQLYTGCTAKALINNTPTPSFPIERGV
jgi:hypothetical protein